MYLALKNRLLGCLLRIALVILLLMPTIWLYGCSVLKSYKFELETRGFVFLFIRKPEVDRACLLTLKAPEPQLVKLSGSDASLASLLDFVNKNAETFISPDGDLTPEVCDFWNCAQTDLPFYSLTLTSDAASFDFLIDVEYIEYFCRASFWRNWSPSAILHRVQLSLDTHRPFSLD